MTLTLTHTVALAAQAAHARCFKQLKLKRALAWPKPLTKATAKPCLTGLLNDPVSYMARYKESYLYTMVHTNKRLNWDKAPSALQSKAVRKHPIFFIQRVK